MNKIECGYCHKDVSFNDVDVKKSGKAELIRCPNCNRSITVGFNFEKYYQEIIK